MIHRVRQLIAQPKDGGDEVNIYAARLLTTTLLVILAGVLSDRLLVPSIPLLEGFSFAISIALVLMVLMMAWFLRRGHHLVAAYSTVVIVWLVLTTTVALSGGIRSPALISYIVLLLGCGLLLSRRATLAIALISIAASIAMGIGIPQRTPELTLSTRSLALIYTTLLAISACFLYMLVGNIDAALSRSRQEIAERTQLEAALRANEERFHQLSDLLSEIAFSFRTTADGTTELEWTTEALSRITGYTLAEVRTTAAWDAIAHPDDVKIVQQRCRQLHAGHSDISEYRIITKDNQVRWLRFNSRPILDPEQQGVQRIYGVAQDITHLKQLEQQLGQAQKFETVGRLAGSVAHDFNNMLTIILGSCTLVLDSIESHQPIRHDIEQIQSAAERAAGLARQLLAFSRRQALQPTVLNLNDVIISTTQLLHRMLGEDILLTTQLAPDLGLIKIDPGQIDQVIVNLVVNARDALPEGGEIVIETSNIVIEHPNRQNTLDPPAGTYVLLQVSDNGIGMDSTTMERAFEPFFTTKSQGTGLGLASVQSIVRQNHGHIQVWSKPGHGTRFKIYLPQSLPMRNQNGAMLTDEGTIRRYHHLSRASYQRVIE